ncbi:hypothetical protein BDY24DRAFT_368618 [Mrakia frigida]|uniref:Zn(II)2Cys6 transcription factor domain-containing protein n=1 Tax=Mrakia frigida TaxID=29902 RepID=UPI003FCC1FE8
MEPSADFQRTRCNNARRSASSPSVFSTPSSTVPSSHPSNKSSTQYPSHYLPSPALDQELDFAPNPYPFGSARSSTSSNGIRLEDGEQDLPLDFYLDLEGGRTSSASSSSGVDESGGFFNDFELSGSASAPLNHPTPPSPSSTDSSLPLPSPLLVQPSEPPTRPVVGWEAGGWDSVSPFAREEEEVKGGSTRPAVGFTIVKSFEETRTPQACQACRSRKSKCDGKASCVRCENRGIKCVYIARSPRVRGKRPEGNARSFSTSSLSSSSYTKDALPHHATPIKPTFIVKSERGVCRSRRESSDGDWEGGIQGWGSEVVGEPVAAASELSYISTSEQPSRRRPQTDPYPSPHVSTPLGFGSHRLSTPPSYNHSRSATSRSSFPYPTPHEDRSFRPSPHPYLQHRHSIAHFPAPPPAPIYTPPTYQTYHVASDSPFNSQDPYQTNDYSSPTLAHQPLLVDQSDASPFIVGGFAAQSYPPPPTAEYHDQAAPPPPQPYYGYHSRQPSFPGTCAPPTSDSHLDFVNSFALFVTCNTNLFIFHLSSCLTRSASSPCSLSFPSLSLSQWTRRVCFLFHSWVSLSFDFKPLLFFLSRSQELTTLLDLLFDPSSGPPSFDASTPPSTPKGRFPPFQLQRNQGCYQAPDFVFPWPAGGEEEQEEGRPLKEIQAPLTPPPSTRRDLVVNDRAQMFELMRTDCSEDHCAMAAEVVGITIPPVLSSSTPSEAVKVEASSDQAAKPSRALGRWPCLQKHPLCILISTVVLLERLFALHPRLNASDQFHAVSLVPFLLQNTH